MEKYPAIHEEQWKELGKGCGSLLSASHNLDPGHAF